MSETLAPPVEAPAAQQGLLSRAVGVITSPRRTYAGIVERPRVFGALVLIIALTAGPIWSSTTPGSGRMPCWINRFARSNRSADKLTTPYCQSGKAGAVCGLYHRRQHYRGVALS